MSQSAPGWYQDHDDPRLARWWDGERWTEHTLVLDEQDWSTEPEPPQAASRFPNPDTGEVPLIESDPALGYETDIYAPIRDPWGDQEPVAEPATTTWSDDDVWTGAAAGGTLVAANPAWDDGTTSGWNEGRTGSFAGGVAGWPTWAKVALPLAVLAIVLLGFAVAGALGGGDDEAATTTSTSSATVDIGDAAQLAYRAAGNDPSLSTATFATLIPPTCRAAADNAPATLVTRIAPSQYDADTIENLIKGLEAGTDSYCPKDMAKPGGVTLLDTVKNTLLSGAATTTSSSTDITVPGDSTTTTKGGTATTKKPTTTTTKKPVTTTTAPVTTTTQPTTTTEATTTTEPTTTTT